MSINLVSQLQGAAIETFYVQIDVCHSADFLICGSAKESAVIWDLQESRSVDHARSRLPFPKFILQGHDHEVWLQFIGINLILMIKYCN